MNDNDFPQPPAKLDVRETPWSDREQETESTDVPEEHRRLLDSRLARVAAGKASIREWDEVKQSIGKR
jgi:hypothetical protein